MENKINIAELLKDCPKGMELDCPLFENLEFERINKDDKVYPIICRVKTERGNYNFYSFNIYGCYSTEKYSKCVIFPKGKTTWEGFVPPCQFKDGDIVATSSGLQMFILQRMKNNTKGYCYMGYDFKSNRFLNADVWSFERLASEEEKQKLFDAIKTNGYKWNEETKTLEKLIKPIFKVGNIIQGIYLYKVKITAVNIEDEYYEYESTITKGIGSIMFSEQDDWELVPDKFDITTLKVFDKVLVRDSNEGMWSASIFSHTWKNKYICIGIWYNQCIPYKGNEHLLGTTDDCDEYYKTW